MVVRHTTKKKSKTNFNEPPHVERKKHKHGKNHLLSISASKKSIIISTMPVHRTLLYILIFFFRLFVDLFWLTPYARDCTVAY